MMPSRSLLPASDCHFSTTIRAAPPMPRSTPSNLMGVIFSCKKGAAKSITAIGVRVAMRE